MKKQVKVPTSWSEVTLEMSDKLIKISNNKDLSDIDRETEIVRVLTGLSKQDMDNMSITSYQSIFKRLTFLNQPIKNVLPKDKITLNNKKYRILLYPLKMTAGQFIDYKTILSSELDKKAARLVAVFTTPEGSKYNDGSYDFDELIDVIYKYMSIEYVQGLCFFFKTQYEAYTISMLEYSVDVLRKQKNLPKELMEKKEESIQKLQKLIAIIKNGGLTE